VAVRRLSLTLASRSIAHKRMDVRPTQRFHMRAFVLLAGIAAWSAHALAQDFPGRAVEIVVPYPPGGLTDKYARLIANGLQTRWSQPVMVVNRPGANGLIGTNAVRNAIPDGHTLLFTASSSHVVGPLVHEVPPFHPAKDFTPITMAVRYPMYMLVNPDLPVKSVADFIELERRNPGTFNCASAGVGSATHLVCELFNSATGTRLLHVGYKGAVAAQMSVVSGETQVMFDSVGQSQSLVDAGRMRGVAVTGDKRVKVIPAVPTLAESGVAGINTYNWLGLLGPPGLKKDVLVKIHADVVSILRSDEVRQLIQVDGSSVIADAPQNFAADMSEESDHWTALIKKNNIKFK
jgi:tripartite-type tricarboxylate transporter receptor subunit TctC